MFWILFSRTKHFCSYVLTSYSPPKKKKNMSDVSLWYKRFINIYQSIPSCHPFLSVWQKSKKMAFHPPVFQKSKNGPSEKPSFFGDASRPTILWWSEVPLSSMRFLGARWWDWAWTKPGWHITWVVNSWKVRSFRETPWGILGDLRDFEWFYRYWWIMFGHFKPCWRVVFVKIDVQMSFWSRVWKGFNHA